MQQELGVRHRVDGDGVVHITFDRPGDKVNLLSGPLLEHLGRLFEELQHRQEVTGVVLSSAKPGMFIAGMDVEQIADVTDAYRGAEGARFGQSVFQRLAALSVPTVCAIGGTCLGGGTEMALACDFRVAARDPAVRIGMPEVQIGIVPGFGGTQRLPPLVGLTAAIDMILTGRKLDARRAKRIGLVDRVVPTEYLERAAVELIRRANESGVERVQRKLRPRRSGPLAWAEKIGPARKLIMDQARKRTAKKVKPEHYPAPFRALEAIEAAYSMELPQGLDHEARIIGELIPSPTAKNLMWLFKSQSAVKRPPRYEAAPRQVRRAAVLGAGIMGGGISQLIADRGTPVRLKDIAWDPLLTALRTAGGLWAKQVRRRRLSKREAGQRLAFISPTTDYRGFRHVDLVVEAVVEDLEIKRRVLADTEARIGEDAVFASNTSSLPITQIASNARNAARVVGLHFFNPVHRMPLVEVIAGQHSSPEAVLTVHRFAVALGKVPVIVKDGPGFLVNRILTLYMNEAVRLLEEGARIDSIDRAMREFGMPMGPLELLDTVGLDTARHVGGVLQLAFGERIGGDGRALQAMVESKRLGAKSGGGFYRYKNGRPTVVDSDVYGVIEARERRDLPAETLQERMVLSMVNEAAICLEEGVVSEAREIDIAMVMGTGFPPFRGGLLRHADAVGIPVVADRLARLADAQGGRFRPAELLGEMVRMQRCFYSG